MDHIRLCRTFGVWMALAAWSVSAAPAPGQVSGSNKHAATAMAAMGEMPLIAPLFIQNGQMSTTVTIVSAMARATTVDVVLLDQTGATVTQQTYPLDGHAQLVVKVADLLQAAGSGVYMGSVKIETDAQAQMDMAVLGQVSITGTARGLPVYFEEEFPMAQPSDTGVFRAVAPSVLGYPVLALRSTSTSYQTVTENCFYENGGAAQSTLQLAPGAVALSGACGAGSASGGPLASLDTGWNQTTLDNKGAAGIEVTSTGGAGALCVYGFAISGQPLSPVYASLNFTDAGSVNSGNTVFAGVPVGQAAPLGSDTFAPALALTNFGTAQARATVTLAVTGASGPNGQALATLTVPGQSSVTVPLGPMNGDPQMRNSIAVQSNAAKGALYASMVVFGGTAVPSVQLLGRDSMQPYNGGAHPWTTAAGAASTLVMFNYSSAPQTFYVAIASGGVLWQQKYQLAALETKTLDIGSLIATGAKDESGLVLPAAATAGVAQWFTPNFGQGAGRLLVSQPSVALARNFGCQIMAVLGGTSSMLNSNVTIAAGTSGQMGPYQADCYLGRVGFCGGTYNMTAPWSTNWTSSNPSVASIPTPSGPTTATIDGNTAGSAGITAAGINQEYNVEGQEWWCTAPPQAGTATVYDPTPSIGSVSPNSFVVGQTTSGVRISGQNFGTNQPQVTLSLGGTVTVTSHTDSLIVVSVTPATAGTGTFTLTAEGFAGQSFEASPGQSQTATSPTVTAIDVTFASGSTNIANTTQAAVVGQQIFLSGNPGGGAWNMTGNYVAGFDTGSSGGPLTFVATSGGSVLFYWVTAGTQTVTYTVSGVPASVTFTVAAPTYTGIAVTPSTVYVQPSGYMRLGNYPAPPPGMTFAGSIAPPPGYSGTLEWVQILNSLQETFVFAYPYTVQDCSSSGLDNTYPYGNSSPPTQYSANTNDSPAVGLPATGYSSISRADSFSMYLLWQPSLPDAIFVPLGVVTWSWGGDAVYNSSTETWSLASQSGPSYSSGSTSSYPSWAQTATNAGDLCGEPYNLSEPELIRNRASHLRRSSQ